MFEVLMQANTERGDFGAGVLMLKNKYGHETYKKFGIINFDKDILLDEDNTNKYFIGHVQAPTSGERQWSYDTSHPFFSLNWAVVHNGVLTNEDKLRKDLPWDENPVDTSLIVNILETLTETSGTLNNTQQYDIICKTLSKLEGTFALAITYLPTNTVYIVRQGSVLHFDDKGNFSTIPGDTFKVVPEGVVFKLKGKKWVEVGPFKGNSPFIFV
jgi:glucosamine 6-phosphate synthetase-like amidotransferase/phosphosugar isomerase protein